jgi:uncharacterized iron-regulated protein
MKMNRCALARSVVLLFTFLVCRSAVATMPQQWQSPHYATHPLVGQIHDATGIMDWASLMQRIDASQFILLGEKHDNSDHHELERRLLRSIDESARAAGRKRPGVVLEMLDESQQPLLDDIASRLVADDALSISADQLRADLDWPDTGWSWQDYGAAISWIVNRRLPLLAGNVSTTQMKEVYQAGIDDQHPTAKALRQPLHDALLDQVFDGHCGLMPRESLSSMVDIQLVKDAAMTQALVARADRQMVLIAGTGHTRGDSGVPAHLQQLGDDAVLSIALIEVDPERRQASDYDALALFDVLIFTPVANQRDYCAELEKSMRK